MAITEKELTKAIKALGKTPTGVRRSLVKREVRAVPEDSQWCAVAHYLRETFPDEDIVEVDGAEIRVNGATVPTTTAVKDFIIEYDEYQYPELVEHREGCTGVGLTDDGYGWEFGRQVQCDCGRIYKYFAQDEQVRGRAYLKKALAGHPKAGV